MPTQAVAGQCGVLLGHQGGKMRRQLVFEVSVIGAKEC